MTKITKKLHPIATNCWSAGEVTYSHFYHVFVNENGADPKPYLMNVVYNFGHIFDAVRDLYMFFTQDPRGLANNVHDSGYSLGLAVYYIITPGIAEYSLYNERQQELFRREEQINYGDDQDDSDIPEISQRQ